MAEARVYVGYVQQQELGYVRDRQTELKENVMIQISKRDAQRFLDQLRSGEYGGRSLMFSMVRQHLIEARGTPECIVAEDQVESLLRELADLRRQGHEMSARHYIAAVRARRGSLDPHAFYSFEVDVEGSGLTLEELGTTENEVDRFRARSGIPS